MTNGQSTTAEFWTLGMQIIEKSVISLPFGKVIFFDFHEVKKPKNRVLGRNICYNWLFVIVGYVKNAKITSNTFSNFRYNLSKIRKNIFTQCKIRDFCIFSIFTMFFDEQKQCLRCNSYSICVLHCVVSS